MQAALSPGEIAVLAAARIDLDEKPRAADVEWQAGLCRSEGLERALDREDCRTRLTGRYGHQCGPSQILASHRLCSPERNQKVTDTR